MDLDKVNSRFRKWYRLDDMSVPDEDKPLILHTYELDQWGTTLYVVRIPSSNTIEFARVFPMGDGASISIDKVVELG